jgi:folate-binding protein YgfZ
MSNLGPVELGRDIVRVKGTDAGEYLQTQLTQDVLSLVVGDSAWSFLLKPKSEIIALMQVTRSGSDEYTLSMDSGWGDTVRTTIDEFLGRMDVSFDQTTLQIAAEGEQARIVAGWPRMGKEIDGSVTPAMTGIVAETVAFDKGCYPGQEFVARVHYRDAQPPKRLVLITFDDDANLDEGAVISVEGDEVGIVTSAGQGVGLGYLKRGVDTPSPAVVGGVGVELLPTQPL